MSRKMSAYALKRKRRGLSTEAGVLNLSDYTASAHAIRIRQSYADSGLQDVATSAENLVRIALAKLLDHAVATDDCEPHDLLAHAIGVATIRALQIHGSAEGNPALPTLNAGANALRRVRARWDQTNRWGVDGPGRVELTDAINLYADILQQSSPAQMQSACDLRHEILTGKRRDPRITGETQA